MANASFQFGQGSNKLRLIEGKEKLSQTGYWLQGWGENLPRAGSDLAAG